jgi:ParB family chromosome partitioning protein
MLGKGLESLIPPQNGNQPGNNGHAPEPPREEPQKKEEPRELPQAQAQAPEPHTPAAPPSKIPFSPKVFEVPHATAEDERVFHIEVEKITSNPGQPRRNFNQDALRDLANSIREFGFLQPLVVSKIEKETHGGIAVEYQLIAGERRLMAAKLLGLRVVPAIVRNVNLEREKVELAVIENIQRENLSPIETARAFQRLQEEFRMTQREIASKLGKSREAIANTVRLLDLPSYLQEALEKGELSESHARFLLAIDDQNAQRRLFEDIVSQKLTTRDVKMRVEQMGGGAGGARRGRPPKSDTRLAPELKAMQESLAMELGAPVEIQKNANNGRITIIFYSEEELENILRRLGQDH